MAARKLPKDALVTEILQKVSSAKTKKEKVELLQEYNNNALRAILIINFDESLEFLLPAGEVPFTPNDAPVGTEHTRLTCLLCTSPSPRYHQPSRMPSSA